MKSKITLFAILITLILIAPSFSFSQVSNGAQEDDGYVYDVVDPKTLEIDLDLNLEHYYTNTNANAKRVQLNIQADLKYFNAPSITIRYGIIKNLEFQVLTGYTGVLTDATATIKTKKSRVISASNNTTGLSSLSAGFKVGLMANKNWRPSASFTGLVTIPGIGNPAFTPDNPGFDIGLNFYNPLNDEIDVSYGLGTVWSGYKDDPDNSYNYNISAGYTFSEVFGAYLDFTGLYQKGYSPDNRFDVDLSFAINDNLIFDVYGGTSFNIKRFYFIGSSISATIPF
ncbi:MAG: transporter [Ignavibacteriae bacterium]|nr:transporter [Ignavibacteriota bacterium]